LDTTVSFVPMADVDAAEDSIRPIQTRKLAEVVKGYTVFRLNDVLLAKITPCFENGKVGIVESVVGGFGFGSTEFIVVRPDPKKLLSPLLLRYLSRTKFREAGIRNMTGSAGQQRVPPDFVRSYEIPLPPLEEQERIVAELEGYRKVIEGARQILANYKPNIRIDPKWPMVRLSEACERIMDGTHFSPKNSSTGSFLYITSKNIKEMTMELSDVTYITENEHKYIYQRCPVKKGDVLYIKDGAKTGVACINELDDEFSLLSSVAVLNGKPKVLNNRFLAYYLNSEWGKANMLSMVSGVAITRLTLVKLNSAVIPLPPLEVQKKIVSVLEAERKMVEANRELIVRMEAKIKAKLEEVWGETGN
jgi:restriction endonuclease S subunit